MVPRAAQTMLRNRSELPIQQWFVRLPITLLSIPIRIACLADRILPIVTTIACAPLVDHPDVPGDPHDGPL